MKAQELRTKSVEELNAELVNLLGEQFKLRMQAATGQLQHFLYVVLELSLHHRLSYESGLNWQFSSC